MSISHKVADWMSGLTRAALAGVILCAVGCATASPKPAPVTVPQIVEMSKANVPSADIIAKIKASGTIYRLKTEQIVLLSKEGVSSEVLDYMQQTYIHAVKRNARYENWNNWTPYDEFWYGGAPFGWPVEEVFVTREREAPPPPIHAATREHESPGGHGERERR